MNFKLRTTFLPLVSLCLVALPACDDGTGTGGNGGEGGNTQSTASGGNGGAGAAGGGGATGGTGGTSTTGGMGGTGGSSTTSGMGGMGGGGAGGAPPECANLPAGPLTPSVVVTVFGGSEDLAFDGKGNIAAKKQSQILLSDAAGQTTVFASNIPDAYGLRFRADGSIVVAAFGLGKVILVSPAGVASDFATGLGTPNGLYPDFDGNVWVTEFGGNKVTRINPDGSKDVIVSGPQADGANGVVFDANRKVLFYTNYFDGIVRKVDIGGGNLTGVQIAEVPSAAFDGMVLDACGHLYVVDQGNNKLYRLELNAAGDIVGDPVNLASFTKNVANAQFGSGPGFDPKKLYVAGNPGTVYSVDVGVPGAPVPTAP